MLRCKHTLALAHAAGAFGIPGARWSFCLPAGGRMDSPLPSALPAAPIPAKLPTAGTPHCRAKTHQEAAAAAAAALDAADEPLSVCWSGTAHGGATMRQLAAAQQQQRQPKQQERNSDGSNKPSLDPTELDP